MSEPQHPTSIRIEAQASGNCRHCGAPASDGCPHLMQERTHPTLVNLPSLSKQSDPMLEGADFFGSYEVLGRIGEGGMSVVFKARHRILNRTVAIKMLHTHLICNSMQIGRFKQEAQALFALEHANIVSVREFGLTDSGVPYMIMDFLEGSSLAEIIAREGPIAAPRALKIFLQACEALQHAHSKGVVHRDIKPSNIVICPGADGQDSVKIVDFGIAKLTQGGADINPALTQTGDVFGSPLYMSPEQCLGQKLDARTDMYALGCVMYETLSGKPPLVADTALGTIHKHMTEMPEPLSIPGCDRGLLTCLDQIIFKTLEKEPSKRFANMGALIGQLKDVSEATVFAPGTTAAFMRTVRLWRKTKRFISAHPVRFGAIVSAAALLIAVSAFVSFAARPLATARLALSTGSYGWQWEDEQPESRGTDYEDRCLKLSYLISARQQHYGPDHLLTVDGHRKFGLFYKQFGDWANAEHQLQLAYVGLKKIAGDQVETADVAQALGDCIVANNGAAARLRAVAAYCDAQRIYAEQRRMVGVASLVHCRLKLATVLLGMRQYGAVEGICAGCRKTANVLSDACDADVAYAHSLQGDAYLDLSAALSAGDAPRCWQSALVQYGQAEQAWSKINRRNAAVACLRESDIAMLKHDCKAAQQDFERAYMYDPALRSNDSLRRQYALVLWNAGEPLKAVARFYNQRLLF